MKKLLTVFSVFFLFSLSSAQNSVNYDQGYRDGYASVIGAVSINLTTNTGWQETDYSLVSSSRFNAERAKIERLTNTEYNKGFIQGVFYAKQVETQIERAKESKNSEKSKKS